VTATPSRAVQTDLTLTLSRRLSISCGQLHGWMNRQAVSSTRLAQLDVAHAVATLLYIIFLCLLNLLLIILYFVMKECVGR